MFNVKAAVSRLEFAPDTDDMEVTDISVGRFVFAPVRDEPVSIEALTDAIEGAGYEIESAALQVVGQLTPEGTFQVQESGQVFRLQGEPARELRREAPGERVRVEGAWRAGDGGETIVVDRWSSASREASFR